MIKRISILILCCIIFISGCNMTGRDDQKIKKLDPEKLNSETTDINDRADYYEKYVTEPSDDMDEEERSKYRVTLHMVYRKMLIRLMIQILCDNLFLEYLRQVHLPLKAHP